MGKKRPLELNQEDTLERKKHKSHEAARTSSKFSQSTTANDHDINDQLTNLGQLVEGLSKSRTAVEVHFKKGGEQVANAISQLTEALDQSTHRDANKSKNRLSVKVSESYPDVGRFDPGKLLAGQRRGSLPRAPRISDAELEKAVFTHQGLAREKSDPSMTEEMSYDRLEILGDAYIELIATRLIWHHFPSLPPGQISQLRELLVKNETLAEFATDYGFDRRLSVPLDHRGQAKRWIKIKGDVFEAYVAAVILSNPDSGFRSVESWLDELWLPKLRNAQPNTRSSFPKQDLAKRIMGKGIKIEYVEERPSVALDGGLSSFFMGVYLTGWGWNKQHLGSGTGHSKAEAGNDAASQALLNKPLIDEIALVKKSSVEKTA